jgi:hypothetical protein
MKNTLIALATAGIIASGSAAAGTTTVQVNGSAAIVPVQYTQYTDRPAYSDPYAYRSDERSANINEREARIKARIERGLNDGRITTREARLLYRQLASIEAKERAFKSDGRLSYREDAELNRDLDRMAENVRVQLRDEERRYSYGYSYGR